KVIHKEGTANPEYFAETYQSELSGTVDSTWMSGNRYFIQVIPEGRDEEFAQTTILGADGKLLVKTGDHIDQAQVIYQGSVINKIFYVDMSRLLLLIVFLGIAWLVHIAYQREHKQKKY
ncbi:MAG: hypothetical protein CVU06_13745, partial [Bacteroidetes bacterium HGW-Bacteroidetes-22]